MNVERRTVGRCTHICGREGEENASTVSICKTQPIVLPIYNNQVIFFFLNIVLLAQQHRRAEEKINTDFIFPISLYFPPLFLYINTEILKINIHTKQSNIYYP